MTPDTVHSIISASIPVPQQFVGPIRIVRTTGAEIALEGTVDVSADIVGATESDARILSDAHEHCDIFGRTWHAPKSLVMTAGHSSTWDESERRYDTKWLYRFYASEIVIGAVSEDAFTRESFIGLALEAPFRPYEADGDRHFVANWIPVAVFGRQAAIYTSKTGDGRDCLSTIYAGSALTGDEHAALIWLVRYLAGASEIAYILESFDNAQTRTMTRVQARGSSTRQTLPPLLYNRLSGYAGERLERVFDPLLQRLKGLMQHPRTRRRLFGILLAYLDAADTHYATTRGRCAVVALDALISLVMPQQKILDDKDVMRNLRSELEAVIDSAVPEAARSAIKNSLAINSESLNTRRRRFFEHLGIEYTILLQQLIRELRNPAVHEGTFGADDITAEGHSQNIRMAEQAIDLFNRAMLSFLGYDGPCRMHEMLNEHMPPRERPVRDRLPDVDIDHITSRAAGLTQFMRPEITLEHSTRE